MSGVANQMKSKIDLNQVKKSVKNNTELQR